MLIVCKTDWDFFVRLLIVLLMAFSCGLASAEEEMAAFDILEYQVQGNTVLPQGKIEEAVYPHMGEGKSIADVEEARVVLEKAYRDAGYPTVFVNIPEQQVDGGVVRLEVSEGDVERLRVVGSRYYSLGEIKERVPELAEGRIPHFPTVQKQLATVNRTGDRQVAPVLRPGKSPGKVEVDLKVEDQSPFHGNIELNNRYSLNTTHTRLNGSMRYDNLWQKDHSLGISFQVTPENTSETKVFSGTYLIPTDGDYWAFYGVSSQSDITAIGDFNSIGRGRIYGVRYIHTLPALSTYSHSLTLGADYKDFEQTVDVNTPISYLPFYIGYDGTVRNEAQSTTQVNMGLTFSMRGLADETVSCEIGVGLTQELNEFECARPFARPNFAHLRIDIKHTHQLFKNWQLFANFSGQITDQVLIPQEQFTVGGAESVRGYLESNSVGDYGYAGTLELRTPSFARYFSSQVADLHALTFFDFGRAEVRDPLPEETSVFNLASVGVGLHLKGWRGMFGMVDYARALRDAGEIERGDSRLDFRLGYEW